MGVAEGPEQAERLRQEGRRLIVFVAISCDHAKDVKPFSDPVVRPMRER